MENKEERDFFDSPSMISFIIVGLLVILIILSQSFAIQSNLGMNDIFRSIVNHNSIYLISLIYFVLIRFKIGKKYFDYLNVIIFMFYVLVTLASLFTIFQSFSFLSIISLGINVLVTVYFGYSFFTHIQVGKDLKIADSPISEISNLQYYNLLIGFIVIGFIVSMISANTFQDVVVYLLESIYQFLFVRYIYLYKEYVEDKLTKKKIQKKKKEKKVTTKIKDEEKENSKKSLKKKANDLSGDKEI